MIEKFKYVDSKAREIKKEFNIKDRLSARNLYNNFSLITELVIKWNDTRIPNFEILNLKRRIINKNYWYYCY